MQKSLQEMDKIVNGKKEDTTEDDEMYDLKNIL